MKSGRQIKKVLILIPTYNEAENIESVVNAIELVNTKNKLYQFKLLIVDDNSPDGTAKIVKGLQKEYDNIELLSGKKEGLGRAYIRGFKYALKHISFDVLIMMDADLSHDPKDIPVLLKALEGSDYVIGSRYVSGSSLSDNWPASRRLTSLTANTLARLLIGSGKTVSDLTGGFKAIKIEALKQIDLKTINAIGYVFQVSLLHAFLAKSFKVKEAPIIFSNRINGKSKLKTHDVIEFIYRVYKLNPNAPIQKFVRFALVGASGTVVNLVIISLLIKGWNFNALLSDAIAIEVSIINNFFLNHFYTFKGYGAYKIKNSPDKLFSIFSKLVKFNLGSLGGAVISFTVFSLLFKAVHFNYLLADILAILVSMSWNYYISTRFVWRAIDKD